MERNRAAMMSTTTNPTKTAHLSAQRGAALASPPSQIRPAEAVGNELHTNIQSVGKASRAMSKTGMKVLAGVWKELLEREGFVCTEAAELSRAAVGGTVREYLKAAQRPESGDDVHK